MTPMRDIVAFRSRRFVPVLPEACQVAPGIYGAELAFWLAGKLARQGIVTSYPSRADAGWLLEWDAGEGAVFQVVCRNIDGSNEHWRIALAGAGGDRECAGRLLNALRFVLHAAMPKEDIAWSCARPAAG